MNPVVRSIATRLLHKIFRRDRLSALFVTALFTSGFVGIAGLPNSHAATSTKTITTCTNIKTGVNRVLIKGTCNTKTEKKVSWKKTTTSTSPAALATCTNIKTGVNRVLTKGSCKKKTEKKMIWVKVITKPSNSATSSTSASVKTCATGGTCAIGDVGPGGGLVFYVGDSPQSWGRYLEVAPNTWQGGTEDPTMAWCNVLNTLVTTKPDIGTGASNTAAMISQCSSGAAVSAYAYKGGGKSDWFLPSKEELNQMYLFSYKTKKGGFAAYYWSSSADGASYVFEQNLTNGDLLLAVKSRILYVRPIRAF